MRLGLHAGQWGKVWLSCDHEAERTYIRGTHDASNLLHRIQIGAQTSMHGEDLLINNGGDWQAIKAIRKSLPQLDVVSSLALIVEAVDSIDGGRTHDFLAK